MKFLFSLALLLGVQFAFAQIPDYFANEPRWKCGESVTDQFGTVSKTYVYYLNGTSTFNDLEYHRVYWTRFRNTLEPTRWRGKL